MKKVVVNCGVGEASQNAKALEGTIRDLALVTGQKSVVTRSRKAIAGFKLREGVPVGVTLTLRGEVFCILLTICPSQLVSLLVCWFRACASLLKMEASWIQALVFGGLSGVYSTLSLCDEVVWYGG